MDIIIEILAGIGMLTVLGFAWMIFEVFKSADDPKKEKRGEPEKKGEKTWAEK